MADKRINALATTASSTASDDFIAVDGTTNGTRKLSAFSPTFGGNATVTGTLTVNGTSGSVIAGNADTSLQVGAAAPYQRAAIGLSRRLNYGDALFARNLQGKTASDNYTTVGTDSGSGYVGFEAQYGGVARILLGTGATTAGADVTPTVALSASTSAVSIPLTTASTTTSTGALVVGNGTSGGLGVGGAINAGSGAHVFGNAAANTTFTVSRITTSPSSIQLQAISSQALLDFTSETAAGYTWGRIASNGSEILRVHNSNLAAITPVSGGGLAVGGGLNVSATTASTSTSSGALVVSGGVGVAGKVTSTALGLANTSQSAAAWGDVGVQLSVAGAVLTDTSSSGTVGRIVTNSIAASALAASSTTTYTAAASLFIAGAPTANTNVTITNAYALYTAGGRINFQGLPTSSAGLQAGTIWNDAGTLKVA